ncbi:transcriptional regulator [Anaerocolumna aminovalerica]|jgi:DNA-binding MarR family transcriptional regulator|uniref:DNA-binding transcriptional regulator, MarR family n=1 Tax=Anaerocolumna aminovalerica TaxID=1527 RepID=A0A1I5GTE1_9FIRM|nr:MarR family transcriptional regulator [Anaerocolumna aminovalerica]MBU5330923.1 MarR family transcriptional regulator [Anaerocolumna aminovalerica]MDU6264139.1 MarR family transcriptional regulator [Anaerocolumna aminovalerica]SFO39163.1 DNA-binding transcriptional regulator, MarR family [Anaerocolumna aminovalerica]
MDYMELAKQFLHNSYQFRKRGHQKKIDETMQGEAFAILYILRQGDIVLPSEISNEMNISSARVAAMLNSLENKGLVTRQIDKSDRRKILVELTQEGKELAEKHNQMVVNNTARMLELLGEHDAKELVRIMGKLAMLAPKITHCE